MAHTSIPQQFKLQDESEQFLTELERQLKMASIGDAMAASAEEATAKAAE